MRRCSVLTVGKDYRSAFGGSIIFAVGYTYYIRYHPGEPVPEENFWTLWCKGTLTEADTSTVRLGAILHPD